MKSVVEEVITSGAVTLAGLILWLFLPVFQIKGINYDLSITPIGFKTVLFNQSYILISPLTITALVFFALSAIIPFIWTSTRYSLYLSLASSLLGVAMIVNSFIFQERYLHFNGYSVLPTETGYFYISFPLSSTYNLPLFLLFIGAGFSMVNAITKARWLPVRRLSLIEKMNFKLKNNELIKGLSLFVDNLGVDAKVEERAIKTSGLIITKADSRTELPNDLSIFFPQGEVIIMGEDGALHIDEDRNVQYLTVEEGLKLAMIKLIERSSLKRGEVAELYE
ncbi:hypothetical protein [Metallosphaera cuprina]|uniref:Uncharacterized protein n=1 Tax=Metallosphaera cuprina (strain Ar-4) TaxID=1006006 RepID=F4G2T9_METCR|nr:hypothetical protein [Metallosphaera cuprina]AEB95137.1 conserved hypothetical protein [Metallosphaera cuprina Ar-4]